MCSLCAGPSKLLAQIKMSSAARWRMSQAWQSLALKTTSFRAFQTCQRRVLGSCCESVSWYVIEKSILIYIDIAITKLYVHFAWIRPPLRGLAQGPLTWQGRLWFRSTARAQVRSISRSTWPFGPRVRNSPRLERGELERIPWSIDACHIHDPFQNLDMDHST